MGVGERFEAEGHHLEDGRGSSGTIRIAEEGVWGRAGPTAKPTRVSSLSNSCLQALVHGSLRELPSLVSPQ